MAEKVPESVLLEEEFCKEHSRGGSSQEKWWQVEMAGEKHGLKPWPESDRNGVNNI